MHWMQCLTAVACILIKLAQNIVNFMPHSNCLVGVSATVWY